MTPPDDDGRAALPTEPDRDGLRRDTRRFFGLHLAGLAVLYASPEGVSGWSEEQIDAAGLDRWLENVGKLEWDRDSWWINYLLHPYWGAAYYTRARERGLGHPQSFGYSLLLSSGFEFGLEALFENPSIQDLLVTPTVGSLLAYGIEPWRRRVRARGERASAIERVGLALSDPLGAINRQIDRLVGSSRSTLQAELAARRTSPVPANVTDLPLGSGRASAGPADDGVRRWRLVLTLSW